MSGRGEMENPATVVRQDQEYVQHLKANAWHREEVDRYHGLEVILQEGAPGLRRWLAASHHILGNTGLADVDAQLEQFAVDARRSPQRMVAAHLANQFPRFLGDRRWSRLAAAQLPGPEHPKPFAVPGNHRLRFHDDRADRQPVQYRDRSAQRNRSAAVSLGRFTKR
jgi:hypothetical protein